MAEAVAAFYAVETAFEGAAVGAYVASRPTVPLHVKFKKLQADKARSTSNSWEPTVGHSLDVVKGKVYIFGGDTTSNEQNSSVRVVTLPSSLDSEELDFQIIDPEVAQDRPLQAYSDLPDSNPIDSEKIGTEQGNRIPEPRSDHSSTAIDANIFVFGGRPASDAGPDSEKQNVGGLFPLDTIHRFSTQTSTWTTIRAKSSSSSNNDIPEPRTKASCTSSTHPRPESGIEVTTTAHGTIFLHGGYDKSGQPLRDTWSFDVNTQVWTQWPTIPDPSPEEVPGEGRISYINDRLYHIGDGFGKVMYIDINIPSHDNLSSTLKPQSSEWQVITFATNPPSSSNDDKQPLAQFENLPMPRKDAGFLSITTGSGRFYNLYFMGQDGPGSLLNDIWTLQAKSGPQTGAAVKDKIRNTVGKGSGEDQWALCEVVQSTKQDGPLRIPRAMTGFACDAWDDLGGGNVVIWGGRSVDGTMEDGGWVMMVE